MGLRIEASCDSVRAPRLPLGRDRKEVALLTSFILGFVVILFFGLVLIVTSRREARVREEARSFDSPAAPIGLGGD